MDFSQMKRWYDGYLIGAGPNPLHVYNPKSVARPICSGHLSNYRTQTESYEALRDYIDMDFDGVQTDPGGHARRTAPVCRCLHVR